MKALKNRVMKTAVPAFVAVVVSNQATLAACGSVLRAAAVAAVAAVLAEARKRLARRLG